MSRYVTQLFADPRAREQAAAIAHTAGRLGATRVPDEAHAVIGPDPSDSAVVAILTAFEEGRLVRMEAREREAELGYRAAVAEEMLSTPESV